MDHVAEERLVPETIEGILTQGGEGRRWFLVFAGLCAGLASIAAILVLFSPLLFPKPLALRARDIVMLPADAHVTSVVEGDRMGDGDVWFTLAEPKGPKSREEGIWKLNGLFPPSKLPFASFPSSPATGSSGTHLKTTMTKAALPSSKSTRSKIGPGKARAIVMSASAFSPGTTVVKDGTYSYRPPGWTGSSAETMLTYDAATGRYHYRHRSESY